MHRCRTLYPARKRQRQHPHNKVISRSSLIVWVARLQVLAILTGCLETTGLMPAPLTTALRCHSPQTNYKTAWLNNLAPKLRNNMMTKNPVLHNPRYPSPMREATKTTRWMTQCCKRLHKNHNQHHNKHQSRYLHPRLNNAQ